MAEILENWGIDAALESMRKAVASLGMKQNSHVGGGECLIMDYVLSYGKTYKPADYMPTDYGQLMPKKECFANAITYSLRYTHDLLYAEGYAFASPTVPFPLHHGWCVHRESGRAFDPTWAAPGEGWDGEFPIAIGVTFEPDHAFLRMAKTGYYGLFCPGDVFDIDLLRSKPSDLPFLKKPK